MERKYRIYQKGTDICPVEILPGITMKTTVYGKNTLMAEFHLQKGMTLPSHNHTHEQTGYLVSGKLLLHIDQDEFTALPGDSWCIPGNVPHDAVAIEKSVAIEIFSPVREEYIP